MLLSMTGFGEARRFENGVSVSAEVRTINSRYFKLVVRSSDAYSVLEPQIEALVRNSIKRGTVQITLRLERAAASDSFLLNQSVLSSYRRQAQELQSLWGVEQRDLTLDTLLALPGAVDSSGHRHDVETDWPLIQQAVQAALDHLQQMRGDEGRSMAADLKVNCQLIATELAGIEARAPQTVDAYRARLEERLKKILADYEVSLSANDLVREVSIYAERADISEEIVRLRSHLEQFSSIMDTEDGCGRKLEFLTQEMFRETNTIGSKSNDIEIARRVIDIKTSIERIREMIQNVE